MNWKALITERYNKGQTWGNSNGIGLFLKYRQLIAQVALLSVFICVFLGLWKYALFSWLFWHFHMLIADVYWKLRTVENYLEKHGGDKVR